MESLMWFHLLHTRMFMLTHPVIPSLAALTNAVMGEVVEAVDAAIITRELRIQAADQTVGATEKTRTAILTTSNLALIAPSSLTILQRPLIPPRACTLRRIARMQMERLYL